MAPSAGKKQKRKAPGGLKISNNFEPIGCQDLPCVAKANGGVSKPEVAGGTPRKRPQEGTPQKKAQGGEGTFICHVDHKRSNAAKTGMADAARVDPQVAFGGAKRKDSNNPANLNEQAGNSPPKVRACRVLVKGRRGRSIKEDGLDKEEPGNARGRNPANGQVDKGRRLAAAATTRNAATSPGYGRGTATMDNDAAALAAAKMASAIATHMDEKVRTAA